MAVHSEALEHEIEISDLIEDAVRYKKTHRREFPFEWYDWQLEGFNSKYRQNMTLAGNQVGKSESGGYHFSCDVLQDYPDWWEGFRFDHCINALAIGVDNKQLEVLQTILFGRLEGREFQGGWIHKDEIDSIQWTPSLSGVASRVIVRSRLGLNTIHLRSYTQTKTGQDTLTFAGQVFDLIWPDEQPPDALVGQLAVRLLNGNMGKGGRIRYTMTPELGKTPLIQKFMDTIGATQHLIGPVSWDECTHMTPEAQATALDGIPEFEHDLRRLGIPSFGSGMVYPITESRLRVDPFTIPQHWRVIRSIDLGINHPTAICWLAYDMEADTIYLTKTYAVKGEPAAVHAAAANSYWPDAPIVFPHDVDQTEKGSGQTVRRYYEKAGIKHARDFKNIDGSIKVEPGIFDIYERMKDGRFKVFSTCTEFWHEFRLYHRDEGKLVKVNDDVMDAMRYGAVMVPRYGATISGRIHKPTVKRAMKHNFRG